MILFITLSNLTYNLSCELGNLEVREPIPSPIQLVDQSQDIVFLAMNLRCFLSAKTIASINFFPGGKLSFVRRARLQKINDTSRFKITQGWDHHAIDLTKYY